MASVRDVLLGLALLLAAVFTSGCGADNEPRRDQRAPQVQPAQRRSPADRLRPGSDRQSEIDALVTAWSVAWKASDVPAWRVVDDQLATRGARAAEAVAPFLADPEVRPAAQILLVRLGEEALGPTISAVVSGSDAVALAAIEALEEIPEAWIYKRGGRRVAEALLQRVLHGDEMEVEVIDGEVQVSEEMVSSLAVHLLGESGRAGARTSARLGALWLACVRGERNGAASADEILHALSRLGPHARGAAGPLAESMGELDASLRIAVLGFLPQVETVSPETLAHVHARLTDDDPRVRSAAADALRVLADAR